MLIQDGENTNKAVCEMLQPNLPVTHNHNHPRHPSLGVKASALPRGFLSAGGQPSQPLFKGKSQRELEDAALLLLCSYSLSQEKRQLCVLAGLFPSPRDGRRAHHTKAFGTPAAPLSASALKCPCLSEWGQGGSQASSNGFLATERVIERANQLLCFLDYMKID